MKKIVWVLVIVLVSQVYAVFALQQYEQSTSSGYSVSMDVSQKTDLKDLPDCHNVSLDSSEVSHCWLCAIAALSAHHDNKSLERPFLNVVETSDKWVSPYSLYFRPPKYS